jgi:hypothetical protein
VALASRPAPTTPQVLALLAMATDRALQAQVAALLHREAQRAVHEVRQQGRRVMRRRVPAAVPHRWPQALAVRPASATLARRQVRRRVAAASTQPQEQRGRRRVAAGHQQTAAHGAQQASAKRGVHSTPIRLARPDAGPQAEATMVCQPPAATAVSPSLPRHQGASADP